MIGRNIRQIRQICQILLVNCSFGKNSTAFRKKTQMTIIFSVQCAAAFALKLYLDLGTTVDFNQCIFLQCSSDLDISNIFELFRPETPTEKNSANWIYDGFPYWRKIAFLLFLGVEDSSVISPWQTILPVKFFEEHILLFGPSYYNLTPASFCRCLLLFT